MNYGIAFAFMALLCFIVDWLASYGKVRTKWQSFITNFFLALPAFFATPNTEHYFDITRFSLLMEDIRSINNLSGKFGGLEWSLHSSEYSQEPFVAIYVWIFSLFKNNGFLFFVSTFIFLMALAWFISQAGRFYHISVFHQILVKYTILGLFNIVYEVAGVRIFLAFMVFCAAFFMIFLINLLMVSGFAGYFISFV
ncbi:hypothetical protein AYR62_02965 [Secundilactobacillus paracollinoides]|uniref:hypothetical protein n=1 Tax=Secundilactobacillus paracollinoides TaxID=240427 RepID=UPI00081A7735|nr:hypothetical protein [Secundilactobacillus paracollinoides]ANZ63157.1 hypothetical protein AYR62_02965 [Secundilactobacillus paracollinoides]